MNITRRSFIKNTAALSAVPMSLSLTGCDASTTPFAHGVASGDPLSDRVIIWTRVSLPQELLDKIDLSTFNLEVRWQVALDPTFDTVMNEGIVVTNAEKDFTVKKDVMGLEEKTYYYFRFIVETPDQSFTSTIGRTKTLPEFDVSRVKIAFTSCSHFSYGYFNVYARMAEIQDIDVVLHLGDYLYEYGNKDIYRNHFLRNRKVLPEGEMISLNDYRLRHATYKTDQDLQLLHASHPMICIWDDHEFANDTWKHGAQNHNDGEGSWKERCAAAIKAYYEWMPIREPSQGDRQKAYRQFRFGKLVELNMLDTRFIGRDKQLTFKDAAIDDQDRSLLGVEQEEWLYHNLLNAQQDGVKWKLMGQQVQVLQTKIFGKFVNADAWDGYPAARNRLLDHIVNYDIDNVIFLTGDVHSSWAADICHNPYDWREYNPITHNGAVAVELVTSSVTSPSIPVPGIQQIVGDAAKVLRLENPHIRYVDVKNRGFVTLTITESEAIADWHHVPFVGFVNNNVFIDRSFKIKDGEPKLIKYKR
ncbi:alkaline phosphatase D family protein [Veronia pacifica]|uniref:Alkaline phosphatase n=1 Tax=Veronia pacifica TaxID=1080227 RepID=A0A1C3EAM5_9GAMM|nr:alkaline phosphatase D family protein [Veronia pacifica]ODA30292.1 alkaline phosphatase [Veronia pacifica]